MKYHANPLIPVKFQFFKDAVNMLPPYLQQFQVDAPMMPFVYGVLKEFICCLMRMILRSAIVGKANTAYELVRIDLNDKGNQLPCELIKLPTATKSLLSSTVTSDTRKLRFKADCGSMIKSLAIEMQERLLIKYIFYLCLIACFTYSWLYYQKQRACNDKVLKPHRDAL